MATEENFECQETSLVTNVFFFCRLSNLSVVDPQSNTGEPMDEDGTDDKIHSSDDIADIAVSLKNMY